MSAETPAVAALARLARLCSTATFDPRLRLSPTPLGRFFFPRLTPGQVWGLIVGRNPRRNNYRSPSLYGFLGPSLFFGLCPGRTPKGICAPFLLGRNPRGVGAVPLPSLASAALSSLASGSWGSFPLPSVGRDPVAGRLLLGPDPAAGSVTRSRLQEHIE